MPFVRVRGVKGLLFVPDNEKQTRKHNCPDCVMCQWCSDARCALCLNRKACGKTVTCRKSGALSPEPVRAGNRRTRRTPSGSV
jgi:hypothetical protein